MMVMMMLILMVEMSELNGVILGQAPSPKALQIGMKSASTLAMRINVILIIIIILVILYCIQYMENIYTWQKMM